VFRPPGEDRPAYLARYVGRIRSGWGVLAPEQQQPVIDHLSQFDFPADRDAIRHTAEACGWTCRGSGRATTGPKPRRC
jgi:hypothetical protein